MLITLARKPMTGSVAANVLNHGTGALNIDACRVSAPDNEGKVWVRGGNGVKAFSGPKAAQVCPQLNGENDCRTAPTRTLARERDSSGKFSGKIGLPIRDCAHGRLEPPKGYCPPVWQCQRHPLRNVAKRTQRRRGWGFPLLQTGEGMLITLARKPLCGSVVQNVLTHGVGALNVDATRIGTEQRPVMTRTKTLVSANSMANISTGSTFNGEMTTQGRWPANLIHDGSESVMAGFPQTKSGTHSKEEATRRAKGMFAGGIATDDNWYGDGGSAARFFKQVQRQPDGLPSQDKQVGVNDGTV